MNVPVKVELKTLAGKLTTVLDDELHQLVLEGLVTYKDAIAALKAEGLALDKRFYPWLRNVENLATGEFDSEPPVPAVTDAPELLTESETAPEPPAEKPETTKPEGAK